MPSKDRDRAYLAVVDDEDDDDDDRDEEDGPDCLICAMVEEEPAPRAMAVGLAYGLLVMAPGDSISTCDEHDQMVKDEIASLKKTLRSMKREASRG
jgi:hypothetical protein